MNRLQLEAKLSGLKKLSTLPEVMAEIIRLCDQPEISLAELSDIVRSDPALMTRILKVVNSPFYGRSQQVYSISQAVSTLGANRVKSLALSLSIYDLAAKIGKRVDLREFWRHSLNVACTAQLIAERVNPSLSEEAFICGCMHDLGILTLDQVCSDEYGDVCSAVEAHGDLVTAEREILGLDHAQVGDMVAHMWSFPTAYCDAIAHHHDNLELEAGGVATQLVQIINLADKLATFTIDGKVIGGENGLTGRNEVGKLLGLTNADFKQIELDSISAFMRAASYLDIDVGSPSALLQKATEHLYELYCCAESNFLELKQARQKLEEEQLNRAALESLQAIIATFSHYLNNAVATISGRTQLLELALKEGDIEDQTGIVAKSIGVYQKSSEQIVSVIEKLKNISVYRTAIYHDDTKIIDLESTCNANNKQGERSSVSPD